MWSRGNNTREERAGKESGGMIEGICLGIAWEKS